MNRDEVKEVFKLLKNVYPHFEVTTDKLNIWTKLLSKQNPEDVMRNVEHYVLDNKFPPSIADVREKKKEAHSSDFLKKLEQWERESSGGKQRS